MRCMEGFITFTLCVCLSVCVQDISKNIKPIDFIFGGGLPSHPRRKRLDFEQNRPGVRVGLGEQTFGPMIRDSDKIFKCIYDLNSKK